LDTSGWGKRGKRKRSSKHSKLEGLENNFIETKTNEKILYHTKRKPYVKKGFALQKVKTNEQGLLVCGDLFRDDKKKDQENEIHVR
jgi:hypothetical protein